MSILGSCRAYGRYGSVADVNESRIALWAVLPKRAVWFRLNSGSACMQQAEPATHQTLIV